MKDIEKAYNYAWYKNFCEENNLIHDNELSKLDLELAKMQAQEVVKWRKVYKNLADMHPEIDWTEKIDKKIEKCHNKRIEHMLSAVWFAEFVTEKGKAFNIWLKKLAKRYGIQGMSVEQKRKRARA